MRALNDNVMVEVPTVNNMRGSLYIPETAQEGQILYGTVVEIGPGKLLDNGTRAPMFVQKGETVYFPKFNASKMEINGTTYYVLAEQLILAVL
jgi:chaperonin GroES